MTGSDPVTRGMASVMAGSAPVARLGAAISTCMGAAVTAWAIAS